MIFERLQTISKELINEKIEEIYHPVSGQLAETEDRIQHFFDDEPRDLIKRTSEYLPTAGGKRIRPALVLLFARATEQIESDYDFAQAAAAIEIIHNATLIHDDVVDEAKLRRGVPTVNEAWDNKTAVLVGDYLYSRALDEIAELGNAAVIKQLTKATRAMSRGELISLNEQIEVDVTREQYYEIIEHKTSSLMSAACFTGAVDSQPEWEEAAIEYGRCFGLAFQIVDDIIDLLSNTDMAGKNSFQDLEKGKLTLPVIEAINNPINGHRDEIKGIMEKPISLKERREKLLPIIQETDGFARAGEEAARFAEQATDQLKSFPDNPATESLRLMCEYVVNRNF